MGTHKSYPLRYFQKVFIKIPIIECLPNTQRNVTSGIERKGDWELDNLAIKCDSVFFTERQTGGQAEKRDGDTEGKNERSQIVIII